MLHSWLAPHAEHTPPPTPHAVLDGVVLHTPPLVQHPPQEVPPQLQAPPLHDCIAAQVPHAFPADPQALVDWLAKRTQLAPWQHPFGHELAVHVHTPDALQACPETHPAHAAPPVPHCVADSPLYGTHVFPSQHPFGHEVASHTHLPAVHS